MELSLKVTKLSDEKLAFSNAIYLSPEDAKLLESNLAIINDRVKYPVKSDARIETGTIGMNRILRNRYMLAFNDLVKVKPVEEINGINLKYIQSMQIKLSLLSRQKSSQSNVTIHETDFKEYFCKWFKNYFLDDFQCLILNYQGITIIVNISTDYEGYMTDDTEISLITDEIDLILISPKLLKRDLFRDDFDFTTMGIGGLNNELIKIFRRALSSRAYSVQTLKKLGMQHVKGILLYGPPGTGKTLIGRNIAKHITEYPPKIINGPEILNKFIGESEKNLRDIFKEAKEEYRELGDHSKIHVIIFDEIDAICKKRGSLGAQSGVNDTLVNQILTLLEGPESINNILLIAMTNRMDLLDPALLRPGRLEIHIPIGLPDLSGRFDILKIHTNRMMNNHLMDKNVNLYNIAERSNNFSGAELEALVKSAISHAMHRNIIEEDEESNIIIGNEDFNKALQEITPIFGNSRNEIEKIYPKEILFNSEILKKELYLLSDLDSGKNRMLILGGKDSGKSLLVSKASLNFGDGYVKYIKPIDLSVNEQIKSQTLIDIFKDANLVPRSLIILDDIEIIINYANINGRVSFSNIMYQTLLTLLKTRPCNSSQINIFVTCDAPDLGEALGIYFDKVVTLGYKKIELRGH